MLEKRGRFLKKKVPWAVVSKLGGQSHVPGAAGTWRDLNARSEPKVNLEIQAVGQISPGALSAGWICQISIRLSQIYCVI